MIVITAIFVLLLVALKLNGKLLLRWRWIAAILFVPVVFFFIATLPFLLLTLGVGHE
jgi:hypothetical protein